ncbi:hypothetical protein A6D6_02693 [Alcanivorax xiamenensis]|uniref:Phage protein, HK97 gp10 family n=1 Tax=Alcanivorax xiamenensis TaxID=1177156 RepID=A0ABQ6Y6E7_9GAMM|nr:HK97-gp10 family putative phage morphogenesis protein [Alcanivorax xiamenensis]KAF0804929.1 hypothetical protein A6D6_02693 [Alcanivorax xiamenensis]
MADNVEFSITGIEELSRKLTNIPLQVSKKPGRRALGKAVNVIAKAARQNARRVDDPDTGRKISQNIGRRFRSRHFRRTGELKISVGVLSRRGKIPKGNPDEGAKGNTPHWHLVELGTAEARAQPFLRPALADNMNEAIDVFARNLDIELTKLAEQNQ